MNLVAASEAAAGWTRRAGAPENHEPADLFAFPFLGAPWDHTCSRLRSNAVTVDVVIASWNSAGSLMPCLDAIAMSSLNRLAPQRLRVLVCDDGSTDSTQADLRARAPDLDLHVIRQDHVSQAFAVNTALARVEADVIVFCDADMLLGCGALDEIASRHERWREVVCAGFRGNIAADGIPRTLDEMAELIHRQALSGDNRLRFHLPTLVPNMMDATGWLAGLGDGKSLLDCEGMRWPRHRFVYGCLFSAARDLVEAAGGMPDAVPRWGFQDALLAARLEALGAFVMPVTTVWGWHVEHAIRHPDQWFQYRRNFLTYSEILGQDTDRLAWRSPVGMPAIREQWHARRSDVPTMVGRSVPASGELLHALGLWDQCLTAMEGGLPSPGTAHLIDECLFRLGSFERLADVQASSSVWRAVALLRLGRSTEARSVFLTLSGAVDPATRYATSCSAPELLHLARHHAVNGLTQVARLHRDVATLLDPGVDPVPQLEDAEE